MENKNFDRKKVIEEMEALRDKRIEEIKAINSDSVFEEEKTDASQQVTVKYLGKMELSNEQGELAEKDVYMTIEEIDGQFQIRYYDEEQNLLGIQMAIDEEILLSASLSSKSLEEQAKIANELEGVDKNEAKTLEELEEEQKQEEQEKPEEKVAEEPDEPTEEEPQKLPGTEEKGPQLTKAQVDRIKGPKISLSQIVDEQTIGNIIGLEGIYMQIVDADTARRLIPDIQIPSSQRTVPIEIYPDGTANVIGEDKLQFSRQEGTNSMQQHTTVTNEGLVRSEQNIETYNIVGKGGMHTIAVGYDENGGMPLEVKYGWRDIEDPSNIAYTELETVHEGPMQQDSDAAQYRKDTGDGVDKGTATNKRAEEHDKCDELEAEDVDSNPNNNNVHEEDVQRYAEAMNMKVIGDDGYPTSKYDLEAAREELERRWQEEPDLSLEELIEKGQKTFGPDSQDPHGNRY